MQAIGAVIPLAVPVIGFESEPCTNTQHGLGQTITIFADESWAFGPGEDFEIMDGGKPVIFRVEKLTVPPEISHRLVEVTATEVM
jgi:hypothetical protein